MASLGFRDRTSEFTSIAESIRKRNEIVVKPRTAQSLIKQKIGVHKLAAEVSRQTYETTLKLGELTKCKARAQLRIIIDLFCFFILIFVFFRLLSRRCNTLKR